MAQPEQSRSSSRRGFRRLAVIGLMAATITATGASSDEALAVRCAGATALPAHSSERTLARATLCVLNAERRTHRLRALRLNARLSAAAVAHSRDMVQRDYFSHTTPLGTSFLQRIRHTGYLHRSRRWLVGENLAWGEGAGGSAQAILRAWMHSPPHRKAILTASYRDVGIGVVSGLPLRLPTGGATYTTDFGIKH
jgi:uncharacterized protein YkwD